MKKQQGKWIATKLEDFFGWEVVVISSPENTPKWIQVNATNKRTQEVRRVKAHILTVPVDSFEYLWEEEE